MDDLVVQPLSGSAVFAVSESGTTISGMTGRGWDGKFFAPPGYVPGYKTRH